MFLEICPKYSNAQPRMAGRGTTAPRTAPLYRLRPCSNNSGSRFLRTSYLCTSEQKQSLHGAICLIHLIQPLFCPSNPQNLVPPTSAPSNTPTHAPHTPSASPSTKQIPPTTQNNSSYPYTSPEKQASSPAHTAAEK